MAERLMTLGLALILFAGCSDDEGNDSASTTTVPSTTTSNPRDAVSIEDQEIADAFIAWARSHDRRVPPLADRLRLILGPEVQTEVLLDNPEDRSAWVLRVEEFRGYEGPFTPLNHLAAAHNVEVTLGGSYGHCSTPTTALPENLESLRQITIQPVAPCLSWYALGLFVNNAGEIEAVVFDTSEP